MVVYHIIGEGEERNNLEELILELDLKNYVFLHGAKNQEEVKAYLEESDVFLMTSVTDSTGRKEAQGVVTIEAQSCGLPVIAFNSGGVPYTIKDKITGYLCKEYDYSEMAEKVQFLIENIKERQKMSEEARQFVLSKYSNTVISENWSNVYQKLINVS